MYKDIVVCINETDGRTNALQSAAKFANQTNADLTAVYVKGPDVRAYTGYAYITREIAEHGIERQKELAEKAKSEFLNITEPLGGFTTWQEVGAPEDVLSQIVYADAVITNQAAFDHQYGQSNVGFINNLILGSGKPIILIPNEWSKASFGSRILIGWDESREAIRAIQDAMPLLKQADHVDVVYVSYDEGSNTDDSTDISDYLARRGVNCNFCIRRTRTQFDTPEKVLLSHANKTAADLVVVGGYGHSRLREIVLGGVTRYLIKHSEVPVLFSH